MQLVINSFILSFMYSFLLFIFSNVFSSVIRGVGEFDLKDAENQPKTSEIREEFEIPETSSLPYLLLDVRDRDVYDKCHMIGGSFTD